MDPMTAAMLAGLALEQTKQEQQDIPMAGKKGSQNSAMLRRLQGDPNQAINAAQTGLSFAKLGLG